LCPAQFNPADYWMDLLSMDYKSQEAEATTRRRIELLGELYQRQGADVAVGGKCTCRRGLLGCWTP
jgi:hypothetical protein